MLPITNNVHQENDLLLAEIGGLLKSEHTHALLVDNPPKTKKSSPQVLPIIQGTDLNSLKEKHYFDKNTGSVVKKMSALAKGYANWKKIPKESPNNKAIFKPFMKSK